jgi:nitrogen regulatory protein PII-like uncharacterized protein
MEVVLKEAGYLLSYVFSELEKNKNVYPLFCQINIDGVKKTKEFHDFSLEESIKKVINLVEEIDEEALLGACSIFPVETRDKKGEKLSTAIMSIIRYHEAQVHILQKYSFDKSGKLILQPYRVIYADGIEEERLKELEHYYLQGIMQYKDGKNIWLRSFS